jgi:zinc transport system substrate-binding protein
VTRTARAIGFAIALAVVASGCGNDDASVQAEQRGKPVVITGLRPLAEAARRVGGDDIVVVDLTAVGESAHELELTARSEREVADADLAIVLGRGFQADLEKAAAARPGPSLVVLDRLNLPDRPDGTDGPPDPHVWLDPRIMGSIVTLIGNAVADLVPDSAGAIHDRAEKVVVEDVRLDALIEQGLRSCRRTLIASQHEAFGWFAARYGFTTVAFDGPAPDADPSPDPELQAAIEPMLSDGSISTLFIETLSPTSWIEVIAEEHGLDVAVLNPYEGLTPSEEADGATYRTVMAYDLRALQDQLDCD